jgi:ribosomal protein S6--L-glutamate ligase
MKQLIILSTSPEGRVAEHIHERAKNAGVQSRICTLKEVAFIEDDELRNSIILPRIAPHMNLQGIEVLGVLEARGASIINSAISWSVSRDKWESFRAFSKANVPTPITMPVPGKSYEIYVKNLGNPFIFKPREGTHGEGIEIIDSPRNLVGKDGIAQQYIAEASGSDIRVFVVGDRAVVTMKRTAAGDDFRANLHQGGRGEKFEIDEQLERVAVTASKSLGLMIAGVDIVLSDNGPLVLEANPSPGLGIEKYTGYSVVDEIVEFIKLL